MTEKRTDQIVQLDRQEAELAKRALQSALETVTFLKVRANPGGDSYQLDRVRRELCVGITVLRDVDRRRNEDAKRDFE